MHSYIATDSPILLTECLEMITKSFVAPLGARSPQNLPELTLSSDYVTRVNLECGCGKEAECLTYLCL